MNDRRVLVIGATGVVGHAAAERFVTDTRYDVITASRRDPQIPGTHHLPLDLRNRTAVDAALGSIAPVTEVVYAALLEKPDLISGWEDEEQIRTNREMFDNVLSALARHHPSVEHISALQGTKAYGFHVTKMRVPVKESQPRVEHRNFYWEQEDLLTAAAEQAGFGYTIWRPQFIFGDVLGAAMNLVPVLGVYAAICRELDRPFSFPGGASYIAEAVDSRLLASALHWSAEEPAARDETFNITNGDVFDWRDLWPTFAEVLDVPAGPDEPLSLAQWLPANEDAWARATARAGIQPRSLHEVVGYSHVYADNAFCYTETGEPLPSREHPVLLSTTKLRTAGFADVVDTEQMFQHWLHRIRDLKYVP